MPAPLKTILSISALEMCPAVAVHSPLVAADSGLTKVHSGPVQEGSVIQKDQP